MNKYVPSLAALAVALSASALVEAQTVNVVAIIRGEEWYQSDADTLVEFPWDAPYSAEAGIDEVSGGTITAPSIAFGGFSVPLEYEEDGSYWGEGEFDSVAEMAAAWPSGTYTLSGVGSTVGNFSLSVEIEDYVPQQKKKVLNWEALQTIDPTQPVMIEWEAFSDAGEMGLILVEIEYYVEGSDSVFVWEAPTNRTDGLPGLTADTTSVEIPAGTLHGSDFNQYDVTVEFLALESAGDPSPFDDAMFVKGTNMTTFLHIRTDAGNVNPDRHYLEQWPVTADGWANTHGWMGWLYVNNAPWAFSHSLNKYVYVAEESFGQSGAWIYASRPAAE